MENVRPVLGFQPGYITRALCKSWRRLVDKMPNQRFSFIAFIKCLMVAWQRTPWMDGDLQDLRGVHDIYTFALSVLIVVSLYVRLMTRIIYSFVYLLICLLIAVENVLSVVETLPIYTLESVLSGLRSGIIYTAEHFIAVIFILSYISVIYKDDLSEMKEVFLRFSGFWYEQPPVDESSTPAKSEHSRCIICLECRKEVALQPCGHAQFCKSCTRRLMSTSKQCPVCRKEIRKTMNIYL